jgi:hypothetical protein
MYRHNSQVVHDKGGVTAWADKHPVYDLVNGPSGKAVTDLYTPEIDSNKTGTDKTWTSNACFTQEYDKLHVDAAVNWIKGLDHLGKSSQQVPRLFGFNLQVRETHLPDCVLGASCTAACSSRCCSGCIASQTDPGSDPGRDPIPEGKSL